MGIVVDQHQQVYFSDVTISGGDLYILEVGFTPPRTYLGPRVRKLSSGGKVTVLATVGEGQKVSGGKPATGENSSNGENVEGTSVGDIVRGRVRARRSLYVLFAAGDGHLRAGPYHPARAKKNRESKACSLESKANICL
jgi:hypothetical protein